MRTQLVPALLAITLLGGCYFGRTPGAKRGAYIANAGWTVVGGVLLLDSGNSCPPNADISCGVGNGVASAASGFTGMTILGGAALATLITVLVPTKHEPPSVPASTAPTAFSFAPGSP